MGFKKIIKKIRNKSPVNVDKIRVELDDYLEIRLSRWLSYDMPHEVTIVIPRVEIRTEEITPEGARKTQEVILNSITVVHSPQRPSDEEDGPQPPAPQNNLTVRKKVQS